MPDLVKIKMLTGCFGCLLIIFLLLLFCIKYCFQPDDRNSICGEGVRVCSLFSRKISTGYVHYLHIDGIDTIDHYDYTSEPLLNIFKGGLTYIDTVSIDTPVVIIYYQNSVKGFNKYRDSDQIRGYRTETRYQHRLKDSTSIISDVRTALKPKEFIRFRNIKDANGEWIIIPMQVNPID